MYVYIMYDLLKIGNVTRRNVSLNQICLQNVHEAKMKTSNNEINIHNNDKKKLAFLPLSSTRNLY
jgi:hypothetical protein